ncbi:putative bifunctional diguanylate cyclase/phosphodiesterase [Roseibium sediminicola]|uniref:EAL domain-containing protein n=1 Tax=Roseibium sediminicola TaxID=2933272 RepID=A0ABT0H272_9HYPH|nr:EAL domain-containing protein [Roseibium sp. CAU 1639]MCK7615789.1 EAL domain-containing protein [Roseibium sp. CAU 1639]
MADYLANVPLEFLTVCLGVALVTFVIGYAGGRQLLARERTFPPSEFGNDTAILKLVVEHAHEGLIMQDIYGHIEWSNPAYSRITGYSAEEILGRRPQEFILTPENQLQPEDIDVFRFDLSKFQSGTEELILNRRKNGEYFWNQLTFAVVDGETEEDTKIILICRDVTSQVEHVKELEDARNRLKHQAEHDDLTGVANRARLSAHLQEQIASAREGEGKIGILHLDLDHFKDVNDSHGHGAGDAVLRHVAKAMRSALGDKGLVARIGGDEFIAVVSNPVGPEQLEALGNQVLQGVAEPVKVDHHHLRVAGSVGLVLADASKSSASELINQADIALYAAKKSGRSQQAWYTEALGAQYRQRRQILARLDQDLEAGDLSLLMEPQYSVTLRQIVGYEVSAQWLHPSEGLVDPVKLLSSQEDVKRIEKIERFALNRGLAEVKRLREASNVPFFLSVNLTGASLRSQGFVEAVDRICNEAAFLPNDLVIELDEKIIRFDEPDGLTGVVEDLGQIGCKIALDRFGGGHGGAGQLIYLDADMVKISPDLINGIENEDNKRELVKSVIRLAANLGLEAVANGVDRPEQAALLQEFGCTRIQGKMISEPLSPRLAERHMREFELQEEAL